MSMHHLHKTSLSGEAKKFEQTSVRRNWMPMQPLLFAYWLPKYPVF